MGRKVKQYIRKLQRRYVMKLAIKSALDALPFNGHKMNIGIILTAVEVILNQAHVVLPTIPIPWVQMIVPFIPPLIAIVGAIHKMTKS